MKRIFDIETKEEYLFLRNTVDLYERFNSHTNFDALTMAISKKQHDKVEWLLEVMYLGPENKNRATYMNFTRNNPDLQNMLLKNGLSLSPNDDMQSLCYYASNLNILKQCISEGNSIIGEKYGRYTDALHENVNMECKKFLIKEYSLDVNNNKYTFPIFFEAKNIKELKQYEEIGTNLKGTAYNGNTLIHHTFNPDIIKFLVNERGLDINIKNNEGQTALHNIDERKNKLDLLLSLGADINAIDNNGNNFLMKNYRLLEKPNFELQNYIDKGLNVDVINNKGENILSLMNLHNNVVYDNYKILLKNGIRFDNYSKDNRIGDELYAIAEKRYPGENDGWNSITENLRLDFQILLASGYEENNRFFPKKEMIKQSEPEQKNANCAKKMKNKI